MNSYIDAWLTELRSLIADLGKGGGLVSPSIYDTAQVLRLYPPKEGVEPALDWLLAQQQADGGWGSPETPYGRAVPTLAAVLALYTYCRTPVMRQAMDAGLAFLREQAGQWAEMPIDALPIATEMILPYLLEEANSQGLAFDCTPYAMLYQLRSRKMQLITRGGLRVGMPPTYSAEALGEAANSLLPDQSGGIGHSPAATAAWLRQAEQRPELVEACASARYYLIQATAATGLNIPGVVPNVWPIVGFELAYAPYALLITDLLHHPALQDVIEPVIDELWITMRRGHGVSFGQYFTPDVDDTGLAMAVLQAKSRPVEPATVLQFKNGDHFSTFHNELNPSVLANAHALFGLAHAHHRYPEAENFLLDRQCADGRWLADKLHSSWLFPTLETILALRQWGYTKNLKKASDAIILYQHTNGGWGSGQYSTRTETSYALIALETLYRYGHLAHKPEKVLERGYQWLYHNAHLAALPNDPLWLGKELYVPYRVDRIYELSALLSVALERLPA